MPIHTQSLIKSIQVLTETVGDEEKTRVFINKKRIDKEGDTGSFLVKYPASLDEQRFDLMMEFIYAPDEVEYLRGEVEAMKQIEEQLHAQLKAQKIRIDELKSAGQDLAESVQRYDRTQGANMCYACMERAGYGHFVVHSEDCSTHIFREKR